MGNRIHNGLILKSESRDYINLKSFDNFKNNFIKKLKGNFIVILDQIVDPQNFGSIIRSAFFIGVDFLMVNKIRKIPISAGVAKVSTGASECMELFSVRNINNFITDANKNNWIIINTSLNIENNNKNLGEEYLLNEINLDLNTEKEKEINNKTNNKNKNKNITLEELKLNNEENVILILGSEGFGVSKDIVENYVNFNLYIPPKLDKEKINKHPYDIIDSLNVGVTAGIIIDEIVFQLNHKKN